MNHGANTRQRSERRNGDSDAVMPLRTVRRARPWLWSATVVTLAILALALYSVATNERFQWSVVGQYLFNPMILQGLALTVLLTIVAMTIGIALGIVLAFMRFADNRFLIAVSAGYAWFFRSIPPLVQILFWYNLAALYPRLSLGVPFGPELIGAPTNDVITPLMAAILGLGLNQAAYTGEVVRGGMLSVGRGQSEAAQSLGMSEVQRLARIVLPQAMKAILPPVGNEVIGMLKNTSLVSVIAVADLLYSAQIIYSRTYEVIPMLMVACIWYLVGTTILSIGQHYIERRFNRGT